MSLNNSVYLAVVNPDVKTGPQSVIFQNTAATLTLTVTNNSGGPVHLAAGASPATIRLFFPTYFAPKEVANIEVTPPTGWGCKYDPNAQVFIVTFSGQTPADWANGDKLVFTCAKVETAAQPGSGGCQMNVLGMTGKIPSQLPATLDLLLPPQPGYLDLTKVLRATLQAQGTVYVSSSSADALPNTLYLTLTNVGKTALFTGTGKWKTTPTVTITFLYGSSPGALAPSDGNATGSVWNVTPSVATSQGNNWQAAGPTPGPDPKFPVWTLTPADQGILPADAGGSITFAFSNIVSITDPGHTRMTVRCSGFPASDTQAYDECVYILDIVKQVAPPTRGLLNFFSNTAVASVGGPHEPVSLTLNWTMQLVDSAVLVCSFPGVGKRTFTYAATGGPLPPALANGSTEVTIPGVAVSTPVLFTLQAYNAQGGFLNALQYALWVNSGSFIDPRDNQVYPTVLINGLYWMSANLNWSAPGSLPYGNLATNETTYGRLYPFAQADQALPPPPPTPSPAPPWRLPTAADWQALIAAGGLNPYAALTPGGTTGFNGLLGGQCDNFGTFSDLAVNGWYWTSDETGGGYASVCQFGSAGTSVNTINTFPEQFLAAVRYVRNA